MQPLGKDGETLSISMSQQFCFVSMNCFVADVFTTDTKLSISEWDFTEKHH